MSINKKPLFNEFGDREITKKRLINGNTTNLNDFNNMKYTWVSDWYRQGMNNFWIPEEVNLSQDLKDYQNLLDEERIAYDKILSFLIFLDSIQTANLSNINNYITASEVNLCLTIQSFQEAVHSQSYSYMLDSICSPEKRNEILYQWKDDEIPESYMLQIQHYMAVTGYERTYIAVLIGGNTFKYTVVDKDEELISMIMQIEKQFWDCVTSDIAPEVDGSESCTNMLNNLYASSKKGNSIILPDEAQTIIEEYNKNKEQESYYTEKKNECVNKLKSLIEENEVATINNSTITWKSSTSERIDTKKLKEEQPEIYNKYLKKINMRRFVIK